MVAKKTPPNKKRSGPSIKKRPKPTAKPSSRPTSITSTRSARSRAKPAKRKRAAKRSTKPKAAAKRAKAKSAKPVKPRPVKRPAKLKAKPKPVKRPVKLKAKPKPVKRAVKRKVKTPPRARVRVPASDNLIEQARYMGDFFNELLTYACRESPHACRTIPAVVESDGSVNAELVYQVTLRSIYSLISDLELGGIWPTGDYWISLGVRYESMPGQRRRAEDLSQLAYLRWTGIREIWDYGRRIARSGYSWVEFSERIIPRLLAQGFHILTFHVRLHWNENGDQPLNQREKKPWQKHYKRPRD